MRLASYDRLVEEQEHQRSRAGVKNSTKTTEDEHELLYVTRK